MLDSGSIITWIQDLPDGPESRLAASSSKQQLGKRKRNDPGPQLATPPFSLNDLYTKGQETEQIQTVEETPKQRRLDESYYDVDTTPRAGAPSSSAPSLPDTAPGISRTSSASLKIQLLSLNIRDTGGYGTRALNVDRPPVPGAADLLSDIENIGRSLDILPHDMEPVIYEQVKERNLDARKWRHSFQRPGAQVSKLPGRLPTFDEVERILTEAIKCQERGHDEYGWNHHVHLSLLESIFQDDNGQCDDFASTSW